jgi:hypothetical protein
VLGTWFPRRSIGFLAVLGVALAASAAAVVAANSSRLSSPIRLDGKADEWTSVARVLDAKSDAAFAFQNDARYLYVLLVVKKPEAMRSAEATGLTILGRPGGRRKPATGVLFLTREIRPDGLIVWRESRGEVLTETDKAEIRKTPRHPVHLAFAVDAKGGSYGPLRRQADTLPPDFAVLRDELEAVYEFRIPLAPPDLIPGGIGGAPGATLRVMFNWGGTVRDNLSTQAGREAPSSKSGYMSGTGRTWGQEFLDTFDSMSRPNMNTKKFTFTVDLKLADNE